MVSLQKAPAFSKFKIFSQGFKAKLMINRLLKVLLRRTSPRISSNSKFTGEESIPRVNLMYLLDSIQRNLYALEYESGLGMKCVCVTISQSSSSLFSAFERALDAQLGL